MIELGIMVQATGNMAPGLAPGDPGVMRISATVVQCIFGPGCINSNGRSQ